MSLTLHPFQNQLRVFPHVPEELVLADGRVEAGQAEVTLVRGQANPGAGTGTGRHFTHD